MTTTDAPAPSPLTDDLFERLAGSWEGDFRLWFRPDTPADYESASQATITVEQGGQGALLRYGWQRDDEPVQGLAILLRTPNGRLEMAWTETFGSSTSIMHCTASDERASVVAPYADPTGGPDWHWRTTFTVDGDRLTICAYNILPDGLEYLATIARYTRAAG